MNPTKYTRNEEVILRKEFFGGIAFNRKRATTLELDKEGFYLLSILSGPSTLENLKLQLSKKFSRRFFNSEIGLILDNLQQQEFINNVPRSKPIKKVNNFLQNIAVSNTISTPETVHLSITGRCNLNCAYCYGKSKTNDLSTMQIFNLIDELSSMKVFQLAIGGGEPFLRKDIFKVIDYCQQKNIIANITTNGTLFTDYIAKKIKNKVGQVNISYNESVAVNKFESTLNILLKNDINAGINLLITKDILSKLDKIIKKLLNYKITKIIILRPKPSLNRKWYEENKLTKKELLKLKRILGKYDKRINVDCSITCLMHDIPSQELRKNGVYGCVAGVRFCTIKNNGDVYPCSFFSTKEFLAGNILKTNLKTIWQKTEIFKKFRDMNNYIKGHCSSCEIRNYCKGCRRIVLESEQDFYGEEKECPKSEVL